jgi:hypothetical protein
METHKSPPCCYCEALREAYELKRTAYQLLKSAYEDAKQLAEAKSPTQAQASEVEQLRTENLELRRGLESALTCWLHMVNTEQSFTREWSAIWEVLSGLLNRETPSCGRNKER